MIEVEKRRQLNKEAQTPLMQFRNEQILTKKDGDRFEGDVVKDEIIEERGGIEEACPSQKDTWQAAKLPDRECEEGTMWTVLCRVGR